MSTYTKAIQQTVQTIHVDQNPGTAVLYEPAAGTFALVKYGWMSANSVSSISVDIRVQGYNSLAVNWYDLFSYCTTISPTLIQPSLIVKPSGVSVDANISGYAVHPSLQATSDPNPSTFAFSGSPNILPPFVQLFPEMRMVCTLAASPALTVRHSVQVISYKSANNGV